MRFLPTEESPKNLLRDLIAALRGARFLAYPFDMSSSLRAVRLALRPLATVLQRFLYVGFATFVFCGSAHAESVKILVQSSPLAGSQYYAVSKVWGNIRLGDRLTLTREPDNRHDRHAVRVEWNHQQLGYVPRAENRAVARALDAGEKLEARVSALRDDPDPWRRVEFEVYLVL